MSPTLLIQEMCSPSHSFEAGIEAASMDEGCLLLPLNFFNVEQLLSDTKAPLWYPLDLESIILGDTQESIVEDDLLTRRTKLKFLCILDTCIVSGSTLGIIPTQSLFLKIVWGLPLLLSKFIPDPKFWLILGRLNFLGSGDFNSSLSFSFLWFRLRFNSNFSRIGFILKFLESILIFVWGIGSYLLSGYQVSRQASSKPQDSSSDLIVSFEFLVFVMVELAS